jgi:hypothetical protein
MSKEKLITIIVSALVVFVLLLGALFLNSYLSGKKVAIKSTPQNNTPTSSTSPAVNTIASPSAADLAKISADKESLKAVIRTNLAAIKPIPVRTVAEIYGNIDACAGLKTDADKNVCVTLWAEYEKDPAVCAKITNADSQNCQDEAYLAKASADKDIKVCANIKGGDLQLSCVSKVTYIANLNENDCLPLVGNMAKECLTDVVMAKVKTIDDCNSIYDANIKKICQNYFYGQ